MAEAKFTEQAARRIIRAVKQIERMPRGESSRRRRHVNASTNASHVTFKISSVVADQIGRYNAKMFVESIDGEATGDLAEADLGTLASSDNAVVWHVPEIRIAPPLHLLEPDGIYTGRLAGTNSDGKTIILLGVLPIGNSSGPTTIGAASEGSEAADTNEWAVVSHGTPVNVWIQTRQAYFHAGDEKWYAYSRMFSYDACGLLFAISAETRIEIDAPGDC